MHDVVCVFTPPLHPLCKKMATQSGVPGTKENKATQECSSEMASSYTTTLRLLQQTVTRHLGNVSYYVVDGGVHVLGRLETGQGSARCLRGQTGKFKRNSEQAASAEKHANLAGCTTRLTLYLRRLHFARNGDKLVNAEVFGCVLVTCRGTESIQQAHPCVATQVRSRGNQRGMLTKH